MIAEEHHLDDFWYCGSTKCKEYSDSGEKVYETFMSFCRVNPRSDCHDVFSGHCNLCFHESSPMALYEYREGGLGEAWNHTVIVHCVECEEGYESNHNG
jgi:hypothetical protein